MDILIDSLCLFDDMVVVMVVLEFSSTRSLDLLLREL